MMIIPRTTITQTAATAMMTVLSLSATPGPFLVVVAVVVVVVLIGSVRQRQKPFLHHPCTDYRPHRLFFSASTRSKPNQNRSWSPVTTIAVACSTPLHNPLQPCIPAETTIPYLTFGSGRRCYRTCLFLSCIMQHKT